MGAVFLAGLEGDHANRELTVSDGDPGQVRVVVAGAWRIQDGIPDDTGVLHHLSGRPMAAVSFDGRGVTSWDSSLVTFVYGLTRQLRQSGVIVDLGRLPDGVQRLLALATVRPEAVAARGSRPTGPWLVRIGEATLQRTRAALTELTLIGDVTSSFGRLLAGRARSRSVDIVMEVKLAGARALPLITLTSLLLGMIMAFVGAAALRPFGAGIYVANVVALAMLRELGPILTAVVMAGRTGSAYAAQLATMKLTEELDALQTMGIGPLDFLVLPRMVALSLMQPLLCVYSNFVGIGGGALVAIAMLDLSPQQYLQQTRAAASVTTFMIGVGKSAAFGMLVAYLGCRAGLRTGRSAAAVGQAATTATVSALVAVIIADGLFAVLFEVLGI
jgi:phospholipid/cholesterol/gamma-HCH transport system permease protein